MTGETEKGNPPTVDDATSTLSPVYQETSSVDSPFIKERISYACSMGQLRGNASYIASLHMQCVAWILPECVQTLEPCLQFEPYEFCMLYFLVLRGRSRYH